MALPNLILPECLKSRPPTVDEWGSPLYTLMNHWPLVISVHFLNVKFLKLSSNYRGSGMGHL